MLVFGLAATYVRLRTYIRFLVKELHRVRRDNILCKIKFAIFTFYAAKHILAGYYV